MRMPAQTMALALPMFVGGMIVAVGVDVHI
jgi:hypothetical protein